MTPERNDRNTILHVRCAGLLFLEWYGHRGQDEDWLLASPALTFQTGVCIGCPGGPELGCPGQGLRQRSEIWQEQRCLYFQRPVTLAFPRVLELQEKQNPSDGGSGGGAEDGLREAKE